MGKKLSKRDRAAILAQEILNNFHKEKLITILQKSSHLARLIDDIENQKWINKEIVGNFDVNNSEDLAILQSNGRVWTSGNPPKDIYHTEHIEVLKTTIQTLKIRMEAAKDRDVHISSANPNQWVASPINNSFERSSILESIKVNQAIFSRIKGRLYEFVLSTSHALNFSEITIEIFSKIKNVVETKLNKLAPQTLTELVTAHNYVNSTKHSDWSNVASGCRRILIQIADVVYPANNKEVTRGDGVIINLNKENYRYRIRESLRGKEQSLVIARDTSEYLFQLLDSVDRLSAKGDKHIINQETAEKIIIYTYLLLFDILNLVE